MLGIGYVSHILHLKLSNKITLPSSKYNDLVMYSMLGKRQDLGTPDTLSIPKGWFTIRYNNDSPALYVDLYNNNNFMCLIIITIITNGNSQ